MVRGLCVHGKFTPCYPAVSMFPSSYPTKTTTGYLLYPRVLNASTSGLHPQWGIPHPFFPGLGQGKCRLNRAYPATCAVFFHSGCGACAPSKDDGAVWDSSTGTCTGFISAAFRCCGPGHPVPTPQRRLRSAVLPGGSASIPRSRIPKTSGATSPSRLLDLG